MVSMKVMTHDGRAAAVGHIFLTLWQFTDLDQTQKIFEWWYGEWHFSFLMAEEFNHKKNWRQQALCALLFTKGIKYLVAAILITHTLETSSKLFYMYSPLQQFNLN